jgi:hypothetical protein
MSANDILEIKERLGKNMEHTITESSALYFVQHKETVSNSPQRRGAVPRIWKFRIGSVRRQLPRIRLPRTARYYDDER